MEHRAAPNTQPTVTLELQESVLQAGLPQRSYLLVIDGPSARTFPLPERGEVLIGRGREAALQLDDPAASRRHARLLCEEAGVRIEDLGSHNGTWLNGERLAAPRPLASRDVIAICDALLVVHREQGGPRQRPLVDLPRLRDRLEEEVERAACTGCPLSLLCFDLGPGGAAALAPALRGVLRLLDVAALAGEELLVLAPEAREEQALEIAEAVLRGRGGARAGLASCPRDGTDAETLIDAARAAARAAGPGEIRLASSAPLVRLGEQSIIVADPAMVRLHALLARLARGEISVLLCGETGSGKEIAARVLHEGSPRRRGPLICVNCAAIPEALAEAELFGHERGAFSGAVAARAGYLEAAHEGTLFLDEVGELPALVQAKLLRALETRRVVRLGELRERAVDVRLVSATNRHLDEAVRAGRFRQDLLFRLAGAVVTLPPLRDRTRELMLLCRHFLDEACARAGRPPLPLSPEAMAVLRRYRWPGNVRELRNAMAYVAGTCEAALVGPWHLPDAVQGLAEPQGAPVPRREAMRPLEEEIRELERTRIAEALRLAGGVQTRAAALLSMPLRTFTGKVRLYGLLDQTNTRRPTAP